MDAAREFVEHREIYKKVVGVFRAQTDSYGRMLLILCLSGTGSLDLSGVVEYKYRANYYSSCP